jgi:hypothetical protein
METFRGPCENKRQRLINKTRGRPPSNSHVSLRKGGITWAGGEVWKVICHTRPYESVVSVVPSAAVLEIGALNSYSLTETNYSTLAEFGAV